MGPGKCEPGWTARFRARKIEFFENSTNVVALDFLQGHNGYVLMTTSRRDIDQKSMT